MGDILLLVLYILDLLILCLFGINTYLLVYLSVRNRKNCTWVAKPLRRYPRVTVQLPIFNERYVVERLIEGAARIRYPKDRLEIQILDDSTDETLELSRSLADRFAARGFQIQVFHRQDREGHKAGALREALKSSRGELILVFDADFIPEPSILEKVVPYFEEDEQLGLVQTRWGHVNPEFSFLTKAQALMIDAHFMVDQVARCSKGLFFSFNGTAGVWRRQCILDAGDWQVDTLTEDLDLSYRAGLKSWRMRYLKDVVNPAEIPITLQAYKSQQFRWAKGSVQTAMKLGRQVMRSRRGLFGRFEAIMHLMAYTVHPLILLNVLFFIPILVRAETSPLIYRMLAPITLLFTLAMFSPFIFQIYAQRSLYRDWLRRLRWLPYALILGTGLAVSNSRAVLEALFGRRSEFIRTPKWGVREKHEEWRTRQYGDRSLLSAVELLELAVGCYTAAGLIWSAARGYYFAVLPCLIYSVSFLTIFAIGLRQASQQRAGPRRAVRRCDELLPRAGVPAGPERRRRA
jgi:cellulose synthase/poly-beta-1,6-N-acetylglucosamine synthase-like glycosyltransferase